MEKLYLDILNTIKEYDTITIFRHTNPDCDAVGSQFGLKTWILDNFPNKSVYALGFETCSQGVFPRPDEVTDDIIKKSLAIILDTSNEERVDDLRFKDATYIIKIDHHPNWDPYGNIQLVIEEAGATCEIMAYLFKAYEDYIFSIEAANYIYKGILTDTLCFKTTNTTPKTLEMATFVARTGIDIPALNRELFELSFDDYQFTTYLRSKIQVREEGLAYVILDKDDYELYHLTANRARTFVHELVNVRSFKIICLFTEQDDQPGIYDGSLRSKKETINELAREYNGGGHKHAAGVKNLTKEQVFELMDKLLILIQ